MKATLLYSNGEILFLVGNRYVAYKQFVIDLAKPMGSPKLNLLHGAVGVSGEAGELLDAIKKHWVYNKPLDVNNVLEELGDILFYMEIVKVELGISTLDILEANIAKLTKRYIGEKYSDASAQARADKQETGETK